jgi:hypothetical protein
MFCPKCAAHNIDDAKYCRVCGADISLLPHVLSGQFTVAPAAVEEDEGDALEKKIKRHRRRDREKTPTLEKAFENIGVGIAFLIISVMIALFMPGGKFWWFWMLIPAFACVGEGVGQFLRVQREKTLGSKPAPQLTEARESSFRNLPPRDTSEIMMPPPSITENTTRHLNFEPQPRNADEPLERPHGALDSKLK